jgi:hypothetical protein
MAAVRPWGQPAVAVGATYPVWSRAQERHRRRAPSQALALWRRAPGPSPLPATADAGAAAAAARAPELPRTPAVWLRPTCLRGATRVRFRLESLHSKQQRVTAEICCGAHLLGRSAPPPPGRCRARRALARAAPAGGAGAGLSEVRHGGGTELHGVVEPCQLQACVGAPGPLVRLHRRA